MNRTSQCRLIFEVTCYHRYVVTIWASHESAHYIGYYQAYDAYDMVGSWCGGMVMDASCFRHSAQVEGSEDCRIIMTKEVVAPTPYAACRKLEDWTKSGKPESYLQEEFCP